MKTFDTKQQYADLIAKYRYDIRMTITLREQSRLYHDKFTKYLDIEKSKIFKNQYYVKELSEAVSQTNEYSTRAKNVLANYGKYLFCILAEYEKNGATDHEFAQLINCNMEKMEKYRQEYNGQKELSHSFFVEAILIHQAELPLVREKECFISVISELPLYAAMNAYYMQLLDSSPMLKEATYDALEDINPKLREGQFVVQEEENGSITVDKYYPPLRLLN